MEKNIFLIPTDHASVLYERNDLTTFHLGDFDICKPDDELRTNYHICITSDEKVKKEQLPCYVIYNNTVQLITSASILKEVNEECNGKIILTNREDLIQDGVQAIDDEFLEWFVKNPSCEFIKIDELKFFNPVTNESAHCKYEYSLPQEEPKQENRFMKKLKQGDKIYLDKAETKESFTNTYLSCRDGVVECFEYRDSSGYGSKTRLFLCKDTKHETKSIVRQTWNDIAKEWIEEEMVFDTDSFTFLEALINGKKEMSGGNYTFVRDY